MAGVIFFVVLLVLIIWASTHFSKKRRNALKALAPSLGLNFGADKLRVDQPELVATSYFAHFQSGHLRSFENLLSGNRDGITIRIFDYSFTSGYGEARTTTLSTVALLNSETLALPCTVDIYPESVFSKLGAALGGQDVDLPEHPEFSRRFILKGSNAEAVRQLIDPSTAAFFESHLGLSVSGNSDHLLVFRGYRYLKPPEIGQLLEDAVSVFRLIAAGSQRLRGSV